MDKSILKDKVRLISLLNQNTIVSIAKMINVTTVSVYKAIHDLNIKKGIHYKTPCINKRAKILNDTDLRTMKKNNLLNYRNSLKYQGLTSTLSGLNKSHLNFFDEIRNKFNLKNNEILDLMIKEFNISAIQ
jgi:hypothetical protein